MDTEAAKDKWERENKVQTVDPDSMYKFDRDAYLKIRSAKPWLQDPVYYKHVRISAVALIKMAMHAVAGEKNEIMGLMLGTVSGDTMIVVDSYPLPVVGVEFQVNPGGECDGHIARTSDANELIGKDYATIGWYHSHPGLEVFLSGIDCDTQGMYQMYQEPWLAIVIDPHKTMTAGSVEIGAFRCYPAGYTPPANSVSKYRIPPDRVKDFGAHCNRFYPLDVSIYKSTTDAHMFDLLWSKYWVKALASSPLIVAREYVTRKLGNVTTKLHTVEGQIGHSRSHHALGSATDKGDESPLNDVAEEGADLGLETVQGLISQVIKDSLFN